MTSLRAALALALLAVAPAPALAPAQPAGKVARVGVLVSASVERDGARVEAFRDGLRERGWVGGRNVAIEVRFAAGQFDRLPALAAELLRGEPDVLVVAGAPAAHAAKNATRTMPIVMTNAADPVGTGLVASLARPGGNITGLSDFLAGVVLKRVETLREIVPSASRVTVLHNPGNPTNPLQLRLIQESAPALGIRPSPLAVSRADDLDRTFAAMRKERPDAVVVVGDPFLGSHQRKIADFAVRGRAICPSSSPRSSSWWSI